MPKKQQQLDPFRPGQDLQEQMRRAPDLSSKRPAPAREAYPFLNALTTAMANAPDFAISPGRQAEIDAGRARQAQLQEWLDQRRPVFAAAGLSADFIGIEWLQLTHLACAGLWLVPAGTMPASLVCPYCQRGGL